MIELTILRDLGYILFTATAAVLLLRVVRVPTIVAYMAAGLVLGPVSGAVEVTPSIELISRVGIALLLFLAGLQLNLATVRGVGRIVAVTGVTQVIVIFLLGFGIGQVAGYGAAASAVLGFGATCTSTVVMLKLLGERRELRSLHTRIGVGVSLVQDVATVLALTLFAGLGTAAADTNRTVALLTAFAGVFALIAAAALAARFILPALFARVETSPDVTFIWCLAWCFLFIVGADRAGLSVELGAFIAGVGLAQLRFAEHMRRRVQPIVNFFLAAFFVSLGVQMRPIAALGEWPLLLALVIATMVAKPALVLATLPRLRVDARTAFLSSLALGQMSEFSFILAALAFSTGVIDQTTLSVITLTGFVTISVSAYLVLYADAVFDRLRGGRLLRLFGATRVRDVQPIGLRDHIIIVGVNSLSERLTHELSERGEAVLVIDTDPVKLRGLPARTLIGSVDDNNVLEEAQFRDAKLVISALQIEDTNNLLAYRCRAAGVRVAIHAFDASVMDELREIGVDRLIPSKHDGTREIALRLREAGVLD